MALRCPMPESIISAVFVFMTTRWRWPGGSNGVFQIAPYYHVKVKYVLIQLRIQTVVVQSCSVILISAWHASQGRVAKGVHMIGLPDRPEI